MIEIKNCKGQIKWKSFNQEIDFKIICDINGKFTIDVNPVPVTKRTSWLTKINDSAGILVEKFTLEGKDRSGNKIFSDSAYFIKHGSKLGEDGEYFILQVSALELTIEKSHINFGAQANYLMKYLTVGQLGFELISTDTNIGRIKIRGHVKLEDYDKISGFLIIENNLISGANLDSWHNKCDKMARSVLDILSLAQGRLIRWSIRRFYRNEQLVSTTFLGPKKSSNPIEPLFSHIHLYPILKLAVKNYTQELKDKTGIDVAIQWFLMHPSYSEAKFLACITALEHLIKVYHSNSGNGGVFSKSVFKNISNELKDNLDKISKKMESEIDTKNIEKSEFKKAMKEIKGKLGNLNRKSLKSNLEKMLEDYNVPLNGIEKDEIYSLISVRNDIVHRGYFDHKKTSIEPMYIHLAIVRELLKRILLTLLEYEGNYNTLLHGLEWTMFPPAKPPSTNP